jgi:gluconolactonase
MSHYEILDQRFKALINGQAKLEHLWSGGRWTEGPVYVPAARNAVIFATLGKSSSAPC